MPRLYSIRSRLLFLFMVAALIFAGGNMMTLHFIRQVVSSTKVFEEKTLPGMGAASELALTAREIAVHIQRLSNAPTHAELKTALSRVGRLLDRLETITAGISREGGEIDVLLLNRLSQSIRSRTQLLFQFANQRFILEERRQAAVKTTEAAVTELLTAFSTALPAPFDHAGQGEFYLVSGADHAFQSLLFRLTRKMTLALDHALNTGSPERVDTLHGEFMESTRLLAKAVRQFIARHPEASAGLAQALSWPRKPGWGEPFLLRQKGIVLEASTQNSLARLGHIAERLSEITADYSRGVFEGFRTRARGVIEKERRVTLLVFVFVGLIFLFLLLLGMVVWGFANRLTVISNSMGKVPTRSSHIKVPVGGGDEISAMARKLEGLLEKALQTHRMATIDELTRVNNRRHFFELAAREARRAGRRPLDCCVMMLDIDKFKEINDTHGHDAGDKILKDFSAACSRLVRGVDIFARFGGEEFVLLMPETGKKGGRVAAERICREIEASLFRITPSLTLRITVSIGMAVVCLCDTSIDAAIKEADNALYRAKANGRNRVVVA